MFQVFSGGSAGKGPACPRRRRKGRPFDPWVGKIPWRRAWPHTAVFLWGIPFDTGAWRGSTGPRSVGHDSARTHTRMYHCHSLRFSCLLLHPLSTRTSQWSGSSVVSDSFSCLEKIPTEVFLFNKGHQPELSLSPSCKGKLRCVWLSWSLSAPVPFSPADGTTRASSLIWGFADTDP